MHFFVFFGLFIASIQAICSPYLTTENRRNCLTTEIYAKIPSVNIYRIVFPYDFSYIQVVMYNENSELTRKLGFYLDGIPIRYSYKNTVTNSPTRTYYTNSPTRNYYTNSPTYSYSPSPSSASMSSFFITFFLLTK